MEVKDIKGEADLNELRQITLHRTGENPDTVANITGEFFRVIGEALGVHGRVELHGIGVFSLELRAPRSGTDPNGNTWSTPDRFEIEFSAAPAFAKLVAENLFIQPEAPVI